jgi:hypothetical protein
MGIWTRRRDSRGSSRSHLENRRSQIPSFFSDPESFQHVSRQHETRHEGQCRKECEMSLVARQKNDAHSVVDCGQCKSQHREGNKPMLRLVLMLPGPEREKEEEKSPYPHCGMKSSGNLVILF